MADRAPATESQRRWNGHWPEPSGDAPTRDRARHHDVRWIGTCPFCHRASRWMIVGGRLAGACHIHAVWWITRTRAALWPGPGDRDRVEQAAILAAYVEADGHFDTSQPLELWDTDT